MAMTNTHSTGIRRRLSWPRAALAVIATLPAACSPPQIMIGQFYSIPTPPAGDCPALLWQFVVDPQRVISGSLSRVGEAPFASLSGILAADESFRMTATANPDKRSATVSGAFSAQITTISIHGDAAGTGCDGQSFALRLGGYFARQGGGGGGGG
jgi:hypothetical protein